MNGFLLLIPLFLIRYGLLYAMSKDAFNRAAFVPPMVGRKKIILRLNQFSTIGFFVYLLFVRVILGSFLFYLGIFIYSAGIVLHAVSTVNYAAPAENGLNASGLYRVSRNPMYVAYFVFFLGCVFLTQSLVLLVLLLVFQVTNHWLILAEERWCVAEFGEVYIQYMKKVRRYL
jgi:protein-S-isoprenylcysteine O-methyltransferase Ste14